MECLKIFSAVYSLDSGSNDFKLFLIFGSRACSFNTWNESPSSAQASHQFSAERVLNRVNKSRLICDGRFEELFT